MIFIQYIKMLKKTMILKEKDVLTNIMKINMVK